MNSFNCIYPNPFRYGKVKKTLSCHQILKEVYQSIKPFIKDNLTDIYEQIDEFSFPKSEKRFQRIFQNNTNETSKLIKDKTLFLSKPVQEKIINSNNLENYYKNLRYLEFPIQSDVNKYGFEIQSLSSDLTEDILEEIDEGLSYIYNCLPNYLPESIDNWTDYALLNANQFPNISHDKFLEYNYELIDRVFDEIQKNSSLLTNSFISGDSNTRVIKIITPNFKNIRVEYFLICVKSLFALGLIILIINYIVSNYNKLIKIENNRVLIKNLTQNIINLKKQLVIKRFKAQQKTKRVKTLFINFKVNTKYAILKTVLGKRKD